MTDRSRLQNRIELLGTCAMIAVAIAMANSGESFAQSALQGTPTVAAGDAGVNRLGPSGGATALDTVSLNSQTAIINWNTFDQTTNTPIDFLPQNTIARFQSANQDFVVLNRVFAATPGQAISINGTVQSLNFVGQTTGSVWFYSPGGIIAGPTSVFNVGNLILTADDIDTTGGLFGPNNTLRFRGAAGSTSAITIQPGAQINLTAQGSYLALVAPQVTMGGTATVNGSAAYIAAEQVDVRINGGAFDIAFVAGTGVANALIHSGTTTGPAAANGTIAMAAMPKNTAITMLVGGTVGYTPAATAAVQNGTVVLSAGQDVQFGTIGQTPSATAANLTIGSGTFRTQVNAQATNILAGPNGGGPLSFTSNVGLTGLTSAELRADAGETVTVGGDLNLISRRPGIGGTARLIAEGITSQITVNGVTQVDASAFGALNFAGPGGDAVGGTAEVIARQGNMFLGATTVTANGNGGFGTTLSGNGTGGTARVRAEQTASFGLLVNDLTISAIGRGGEGGGQFPPSPVGGNAVGGLASLEIANQGFVAVGNLGMTADALGGTGGTTGGNASGGTAQIDMGTGALTGNTTSISAFEQTGSAGVGGTTGSTSGTGLARVRTLAGSIRVGSLTLNTDARSVGIVRSGPTGPAVEGSMRAGTVSILADTGSISAGGALSISASAFGQGRTFATAAGPSTGGTVSLIATNNGSISAEGVFADALAFGTSALTTAGNATAGTITLTNTIGGGYALDPDDQPHDIVFQAYAVGASGAAPAGATGGQVAVSFGQGTTRGIGFIAADATGYAGASTTGGSGAPGRGGRIDFTLNPGADVRADSIQLTADGTSVDEREGLIGPGPGSAGFGGTIVVGLNGGTLTTDSLRIATSGRGAFAFGAAGAPGGIAGPGTGGNATVTIDGAVVSLGSIDIAALGTGGEGGEGILEANINATGGGNGTGGTATLQFNIGELTTGTVNIVANGIGGRGGEGFGTDGAAGGRGTGGTATFRSLAASTLAGDAVNVSALGTGGEGGASSGAPGSAGQSFNGGNGGSGFGGTALIDWGGARTGLGRPPSLGAFASGTGAIGGIGFDDAPGQAGTAGGQGGDGTGGASTILISGPSTDFSNVIARARASGGDSAIGNGSRRGGDATAGVAAVRVIDAALVAGVIDIDSRATAGTSATGRFGAGPRGGDATGGSSLFEVSGANGSYVASTGGQFVTGGIPVFSLDARATATDGISGSSGTVGGAGGRGGNGAGGQVTVRALDGLIDLSGNTQTAINVNTVGGNAGNGGSASTYQPGGGGAGGDAGAGTGGTVTLTSEGGRIVSGDLVIASNATAGNVGFGGFDAGQPASPGVPAIPPAYGGTGATVFGTGGTISIDTRTSGFTGADGRITTGTVTANVAAQTGGYLDFGYAGSVSVSNTNTGGGVLRLGALTVDAGSPAIGFAAGSTTFAASNAPIAVDGDIRVTGSTNVYMESSGAGSITAGGVVDLNIQGNFGVDQFGSTGQPALKAASIIAAAGSGIAAQNALIVADNDITLSSSFGSIATGRVTAGRDVRATVDTGNILLGPVSAGRNAAIYGSPTVSTITVGTAIVGGFLEARGATLNFGNVTAGTDAILSTFNGGLTVGDVTAGDDIFLTVNGSFANPDTISPDSQTGLNSTTVNALVAGNLRSTGLGSDIAASGPATFSAAGPTGNAIRVRSSGLVQTGNIVSSDRIILVSDQARVTTGSLTAPGGIAALARTGVGLGAVDTNGLLIVRSSDQFPVLISNYQVASLNAGSASGAVSFETLGPVNLTSVRAASVEVNANAAIGYDSIVTTGRVDLANAYAQGNNVTGGTITAGGVVGILSSGNIGFTTIITPSNASIAGSGTITGTSLTASTFSLSGRTGVNVTAASATAPASSPGLSTLQATNGAINVPNLQSFTPIFALGRSVFARGPGALIFNNIQATAGDIDVVAATGLTINQATASGALTLGTGGTATLNGVATGTTVTVGSGDIVIAANGRLGTFGTTTQITLTNGSTQNRTTIGGAGTTGYSLSEAETGRLFARSITINAPVIGGPAATTLGSARAPDVVIDSLAFNNTAQLGGIGALSIVSAGKVRVTGPLALTNVSGGHSLVIRGDEAIEILDAGRITMNGQGGLNGTLSLTSRNIVASSSAALADFATATTLSAISDRAGRNDGTVDDGGYLQAGGIEATLLASTLIIQNTGTATTTGNRDFAGRRGFTVGAGGFTIVQGSTNPVRVAINGRQVSTATAGVGGFTTGIDLIPLITFVPQQSGTPFTFPANGATAAQLQTAAAIFDPLSTVNGCTIVSAASCQGTTINDPIRDILEGDFGEGSIANLLPISIVQLKENAGAGDEPLIDEPVTGAGNDDLWSVDDSPACDPAKELCKQPG